MSDIVRHPELLDRTSFHRPDYITEPLYVITPIFNPIRYRTRWKHYKNFEKYVLDSGAHLVTIEATFGERAEAITTQVHENHTVIHVRTRQEIWLKENMLNLAISRLPSSWKYVAWVDADVSFGRPDWVGETLQQLQHYKVVQMFSEAYDMDSNWEIIKQHKGFVWCYKHENDSSNIMPQLSMGAKMPDKPKSDYTTTLPGSGVSYWHPGFAWAFRREAIEDLGGLVDWSILGGGDTFMAFALIGALSQRTMPRSLGSAGVRLLQHWQDRAERYIRRNIGFVHTTLLHHWHGSRKDRGYYDRGTILTKASFDPEKDLYRDAQLLYQISPENKELRDGAQIYFRQRNEDGLK